jgi:hypothetical protein
MSMQTIATGLNRRRSSRCAGHYGAGSNADVTDEVIEVAGIGLVISAFGT